MSEVELNGVLYRCGKLPTRMQLYVVKRLAPALHPLMPLFGGSVNVYEAMAALSNTINVLSDADADFVMDSALSCVAWRQGASWQPLRVAGGQVMVGGADRLDVQLRLLWEVLQESLSDFSLGLLLPFLTTATATNGLDQEEEQPQEQADPMVMQQRPRAGLSS